VKLEQMEDRLCSLKGYSPLKNPQKDLTCIAAVETELEDGTMEMSYLRVKILEVENDTVISHPFSFFPVETFSVCLSLESGDVPVNSSNNF
jgi:hypothetical protein